MNAIAPLFLTLLLSACTAPQKPEPEVKRAHPKPQEIPGPIHEAEEKEGREAKRERMALRW